MGAKAGPPSTAEFVGLMALATSLSALAIDALLPAMTEISQSLKLSAGTSIQLVTTLFILGMSLGEITFGPISDRFGRKRAMMVGLAIFFFGSAWALLSQSYADLLAARVVQGFGVAGVKIASRAMVRDTYEGKDMARVMSTIFAIFMIVPLIAPAIGQLMLSYFGWKSIPVLFLLYSLILGAWLYLKQPETLAKDKRAPLELMAVGKSAVKILRHTQVMAYTSIAGLVFGVQLLYLGSIESILGEAYGIGSGFALFFAVNAIGLGVAFFLNSVLVSWFGMRALVASALLLLMVAGLTIKIGSYFGSGDAPPLLWFIGACFIMLFAIGLVFGNINAMAMQYLGGMAGLGASIIAAASSLIAFVVAAILDLMHHSDTSALAAGLLACGILSALLLYSTKRVAPPCYL